MPAPEVHGILLAAGAGTRMGRPKALVHDPDGTSWLRRSVAALTGGGCTAVTVVLGASAAEARRLLPGSVRVVEARDWASGMGASLRTGLAAVPTSAAAVLVTLVDLPDVGPAVVHRLLSPPPGPDTLRRATYDGAPGHPVLLGRDHWPGVVDAATGDQGARGYLREHLGREGLVPCEDLASGADVDHR